MAQDLRAGRQAQDGLADLLGIGARTTAHGLCTSHTYERCRGRFWTRPEHGWPWLREAFSATLDREVLSRCHFRAGQEATSVLSPYLDRFCNRSRWHRALWYPSPQQLERWAANPGTPTV